MSRIVLLMGPPGAGKGTQAAHLVERWGLLHVATGDLLREAVANGTELGRTAKEYMDAGKLVPDEVIIGMLGELVADLSDGGALIDGFPRTVAQAEALDGMLQKLERGIDAVLDVRVPTDVLIDRLGGRFICRACQAPFNVNTRPPLQAGVCDACGGELYQRADDAPDAVAKRLEVYGKQTAPVSAYYSARGLLTEIDGNQPVDAVEAALDAALG